MSRILQEGKLKLFGFSPHGATSSETLNKPSFSNRQPLNSSLCSAVVSAVTKVSVIYLLMKIFLRPVIFSSTMLNHLRVAINLNFISTINCVIVSSNSIKIIRLLLRLPTRSLKALYGRILPSARSSSWQGFGSGLCAVALALSQQVSLHWPPNYQETSQDTAILKGTH